MVENLSRIYLNDYYTNLNHKRFYSTTTLKWFFKIKVYGKEKTYF